MAPFPSLAMEQDPAISQLVSSSRCSREFQQWQSCYQKAPSGGSEKCTAAMKEFQFCMTRRNEEALQVNETFEKFKEKWGHYPNEPR